MNATSAQAHLSFARIFGAFAVALAIIATQVALRGPKTPENDEFSYLKIADDLNRHHIFSDGSFAKNRNTVEPGRFFAPTYPTLLHLLSRADPSLAEAISCHLENRTATRSECKGRVVTLQIFQIVIAAVQAVCVFVISILLSGSAIVAWLTMAIALGTGEFGYYAWTYLSENTAFLGFYLFLAFAVLAASRGYIWAFAAAGMALAFAALSRPSYVYLFYVLVLLVAVLAAFPKQFGKKFGFGQAAAFFLAGVLILAPWMLRNWVQFGDPGLTSGYGGFILVQRVAYNAMTWSEWALAWIYWLPDFGDNLTEALFAPEKYSRLIFSNPDGFYLVGNNQLRHETLLAAGGREQHLGYLFREYVLGDFFKHVMVTLPLTLRGMWVGKYVALIGIFLLVPVGIQLWRQGRILPYLSLVLPLLFMAGLHGFVSVNVPRYNVPIITLFSFLCAYGLVDLARKAVNTRSTVSRTLL